MKKLQVKLSDGRLMPLEDLVRDYTNRQHVGKWFRIDRNVIDKNRDEIYKKCIEIGPEGEKLWKRFEESNEIANYNCVPYAFRKVLT